MSRAGKLATGVPLAFALLLSWTATATGGTRSRSEAIAVLSAAATLTPADGLPVKCCLPLVSYGREHWSDPSIHDAVQELIGRPALQRSILSGHFRIHYDTAGTNAPAMLDGTHQFALPGTFNQFADSVAASAEYVYRLEVDMLGYASPPQDDTSGGGPEYDIYIVDLSAAGYPGVYGYTAPDDSLVIDGGRSTTFMVIDNQFLFLRNIGERGIPAMHVTVAHEFHHAIQIGGYAWWVNEKYMYELTSVWMETVVYPSVKDYIQYVQSTGGQFASPGTPFFDNGMIMYSRGIWGIYVAKRFDVMAMRRIWERVRTARPLGAIDAALRQFYNSNFVSSFAEWELWNYFTGPRSDTVSYYPLGQLYPLITTSAVVYSGGSRSVPGAVAPLAAQYVDVSGGIQPLSLVAANIDFGDAVAGSTSPEAYTFDLSPTQPDATYRGTLAGVYVKLSSANSSHWWNWDVVNGIVGTHPVDETLPFPNPFLADGFSRVYIPTAELQGTLSIYSNSMALVFQAAETSVPRLGRRAFSWDGMTNDNVQAASGVYVYVLSLANRTVTGKIALLRKP